VSFVLDASASFAWAFSDKVFVSALPALDAIQRRFAEAPVLWHFEVASALRKASRDSRISDEQVTSFLGLIDTLDIRTQHDPPSMSRLLELASRYSLTTYDATYLELAMRLGLPLATLDNNLARAAQMAGVTNLLRL
jgi:predicted nucleic acid-binding protein